MRQAVWNPDWGRKEGTMGKGMIGRRDFMKSTLAGVGGFSIEERVYSSP